MKKLVATFIILLSLFALTAEENKTEKVAKKATKVQIANAVEALFNVKVLNVNTMTVKGKEKRVGANVGKRADWKKAIVTLKPESKAIEFFDGMA